MQAATAPPPGILWPIDPPHILTSSFGEYRRGHFHGGVDFSTGRKTGLPIYAVADGWVWRVRASGTGYGRSLYVRLADGRTAVYGHLESFNAEITAFVETEQENLSRYEVDLFPGRDRLRFSAGAVLGRTGESGAGPAHLHFEIRDGAGADLGLNPLLAGLEWPDTTAPTIRAVKFRPHGPGARINGGTAPVILTALDLGNNRYRMPDVTIEGGALVSVKAWDATVTGNRLAPQAAVIEAGGAVLHAMRLTRFDWNSAHQVELVYDAERARHGDSFYMNLYRPEGATDPAFDAVPPLSGRLATDVLTPGSLAVTIRVGDAAGNEARLDGGVELKPATVADEPDAPGVFRVARGKAMTIRSGRLTMTAPDDAFFGPGTIAFSETTVTAGEDSGLEIAGGGVSVAAPDLVLDRSVRVTLTSETENARGLGLYRASGPNGFSWVGDDAGADGIGGDTRTLDTFVLARDVAPPRVRIRSPRVDVKEGARPALRIVITDRGSGFGWSDISTEIDGVTQIVVFDPEAAILSGQSRRALAAGAHTLVITVRDRAGNETKETRTFTVSG